ncbi:MAG: surface glycoprotein, partial [Haloferacaceae archaeon]
MTDDIHDKARAVLLAFVMVTSVMVGTVAFSGSAAAAVNDAPSGADRVTPNGDLFNTTVEHSVQFNVTGIKSDDATADNITIGVEEQGGLTSVAITDADLSIENSSRTTISSTTSITGSDNATVTFTSRDGDATEEVIVTGTVTVNYESITSDGTSIHFDQLTDNSDDGSIEDTVNNFGPTITIQTDAVRATNGGSYDTANGEGTVFPGAVVFQGEEDITFGGTLDDALTGIGGDAEGQVVSPPIP